MLVHSLMYQMSCRVLINVPADYYSVSFDVQLDCQKFTFDSHLCALRHRQQSATTGGGQVTSRHWSSLVDSKRFHEAFYALRGCTFSLM